MAASYVSACTNGTNVGANPTSISVALAAAPTAGDQVVAVTALFRSGSAPVLTSVTDDRNAGNYLDGTSILAGTTDKLWLHYKENIATVTTPYNVAANGLTCTAGSLTVHVARGLATSSSLSGTNTGTATSPNPSSGSITPSTNAIYFGACLYSGNTTTITEDTVGGWTLGREEDEANVNEPQNVEYRVGSGAQTAGWTLGASRIWGALLCGFVDSISNPNVLNVQPQQYVLM